MEPAIWKRANNTNLTNREEKPQGCCAGLLRSEIQEFIEL